MSLKIVAISDTHGYHRQIDLPDGDMLIHAGDITNKGEISILHDFAEWMRDLPFAHKVFIAGNHELSMQGDSPQKTEILKMFQEFGLNYLENSGVKIEGLNIWGSPNTPYFHGWAWNLPRNGIELQENWEKIPDNTNILISHGPPYQILDRAPRDGSNYEHAGCELLLKRIKKLPNLRAHFWGHIHWDYGMTVKDGIIFGNAATCTERYQPTNKPLIIELDSYE